MTTPRQIIFLFFLGVAAYFLIQIHHILLPFVLAATIAYLMNPLVDRLQVQGFRRQSAAILVFGTIGSVAGLAIYIAITMVSREAVQIAQDMPMVMEKLHGIIDGLVRQIPFLERWLGRGSTGHHVLGHSWVARITESAPSLAVHILPVFELAILVPFLTFFLMLDGQVLRDAVVRWMPARHVEMTLSIMFEIDNSLGNYLRGLCIEAVFLGLLAGVGFWGIGLDYAAQIALWTALSGMIPLLGPLSAAAVGGVVALVQWGTLVGLLKVLAICAVIRLIDDIVLQPWIMRRAVLIHPIIIVFSLMAGGTLFGFWGLLFGVPVACMVKVVSQTLWQWYHSEYGAPVTPMTNDALRIPVI